MRRFATPCASPSAALSLVAASGGVAVAVRAASSSNSRGKNSRAASGKKKASAESSTGGGMSPADVAAMMALLDLPGPSATAEKKQKKTTIARKNSSTKQTSAVAEAADEDGDFDDSEFFDDIDTAAASGSAEGLADAAYLDGLLLEMAMAGGAGREKGTGKRKSAAPKQAKKAAAAASTANKKKGQQQKKKSESSSGESMEDAVAAILGLNGTAATDANGSSATAADRQTQQQQQEEEEEERIVTAAPYPRKQYTSAVEAAIDRMRSFLTTYDELPRYLQPSPYSPAALPHYPVQPGELSSASEWLVSPYSTSHSRIVHPYPSSRRYTYNVIPLCPVAQKGERPLTAEEVGRILAEPMDADNPTTFMVRRSMVLKDGADGAIRIPSHGDDHEHDGMLREDGDDGTAVGPPMPEDGEPIEWQTAVESSSPSPSSSSAADKRQGGRPSSASSAPPPTDVLECTVSLYDHRLPPASEVAKEEKERFDALMDSSNGNRRATAAAAVPDTFTGRLVMTGGPTDPSKASSSSPSSSSPSSSSAPFSSSPSSLRVKSKPLYTFYISTQPLLQPLTEAMLRKRYGADLASQTAGGGRSAAGALLAAASASAAAAVSGGIPIDGNPSSLNSTASTTNASNRALYKEDTARRIKELFEASDDYEGVALLERANDDGATGDDAEARDFMRRSLPAISGSGLLPEGIDISTLNSPEDLLNALSMPRSSSASGDAASEDDQRPHHHHEMVTSPLSEAEQRKMVADFFAGQLDRSSSAADGSSIGFDPTLRDDDCGGDDMCEAEAQYLFDRIAPSSALYGLLDEKEVLHTVSVACVLHENAAMYFKGLEPRSIFRSLSSSAVYRGEASAAFATPAAEETAGKSVATAGADAPSSAGADAAAPLAEGALHPIVASLGLSPTAEDIQRYIDSQKKAK